MAINSCSPTILCDIKSKIFSTNNSRGHVPDAPCKPEMTDCPLQPRNYIWSESLGRWPQGLPVQSWPINCLPVTLVFTDHIIIVVTQSMDINNLTKPIYALCIYPPISWHWHVHALFICLHVCCPRQMITHQSYVYSMHSSFMIT